MIDVLTTLDQVKEGLRAVVEKVGCDGWARRLYYMGLVPGSIVEVVFNKGRGPIVIRVGETEVSVGRGIARNIIVKVEQ